MAPTADLPTNEAAAIAPGVVDLTFRRRLPAPRAAVWAAWTEADRFAKWFGPHGATMDPCELDVRVGGRLFFCHRGEPFGEVWVRGQYLVVEAPRRLVGEFRFADPEGRERPREGFADASRFEVILEDDGDGTAMTVHHTGLSVDQGESEGWRQTLERLAAFLSASS